MASSGDLEGTYQLWRVAASGSDEERQLTDQLLRLAAVQIRRVVSKLSCTIARAAKNQKCDLDDACATAMLKLYGAIVRWRATEADQRPRALKPYVNQIARNVSHDVTRERNPAWFTVAGKVLWKLRHSREFVVWDDEEDRLCALAETAGKAPELDPARLEAASADLRQQRDWSRAPVEELLAALLSAVDRPVPFEALVDLALQCSGGKRSTRSLEEEIAPGLTLTEVLVDGSTDPEKETRTAETLHWVWNEMGALLQAQRQVCGLNLEAAVGTRLEVFVLSGVADQRRYEILIRPLLIHHLPGSPPLTDLEIAHLLQTDAKRVSNFRISSQRRLARRYLERCRSGGSIAHDFGSWREGAQSRS